MKRIPRGKAPKESLVTDQPGRKIVFMGILASVTLGFFVRAVTHPNFINSELEAAVANVHHSTQISWSQASISLRNGLLPRLSVLVSDVKIISQEKCWGEPILYAHEVELPFSFVSFFERGEPLKKIIVRDSFLEIKSRFQCAEKVKPTTVEAAPRKGAIRLRAASETVRPPPLVLQEFSFQKLKLRQPNWIFPDWELRSLYVNIEENSPWYIEANADLFIPETEGVESRAQLNVVYKEFPSQLLEASLRGRWREGNFRVRGNWQGPEVGWSFNSQFNYFPFQFLKSLALKTNTPWNWPDKPMWFSFDSQTLEPFSKWQDSKHLVRGLKIEGDLGELSIPDLQIQSWQPFRVAPFVFALSNADASSVLHSTALPIPGLQSLGILSGQGQWLKENEFRFQGQIQGPQVNIKRNDKTLTHQIAQAKVLASLVRGQWKIELNEWDISKGSGPAMLRVEGPQNLKSGHLSWSSQDLVIPATILQFYNIVSLEEKWDWRLHYNWKQDGSSDFTSVLSVPQLRTSWISLERPILTVKRQESQRSFQLTSAQTRINAPLDFFPEELQSRNYPLRFGRSQFQWRENSQGKGQWNLTSARAKSKGETVASSGALQGTLSLENLSFRVTGTYINPVLRTNSR